jgi:hypothetical protein
MAIVNVVVIHGIGDLRENGSSYSAPLQRNIRRAFGTDDPNALQFHEVNWSDIGSQDQLDLINRKHVLPAATLPDLRTMLGSPLDAAGEVADSVFNVSEQARRFLLTGVGDVLVYLTDAGGKQIRQRLIDTILEVRASLIHQYPHREQHYISIVAHSLGSVIAYDVCALLGTVLRSEIEGVGLSHFFTLGSPLALFSLLRFGDEIKRYAQRGVYLDRPNQSGQWINFYDQQDPLAFLLRDVYPPLPDIPGRSYTIRDMRVQTGTFKAHTGYFANRRVAHTIARYLRTDYHKDRP